MLAPLSESAPLVLVIDDAEDDRDLYGQSLKHEGLRVATAADGIEGLALAILLQPDVIILDLGLPRLDGWQVANRLKSAPATRGIPIVALSGHVTKDSSDRALAAGVDEFCAKPCLPADLAATIRQHLPAAPEST